MILSREYPNFHVTRSLSLPHFSPFHLYFYISLFFSLFLSLSLSFANSYRLPRSSPPNSLSLCFSLATTSFSFFENFRTNTNPYQCSRIILPSLAEPRVKFISDATRHSISEKFHFQCAFPIEISRLLSRMTCPSSFFNNFYILLRPLSGPSSLAPSLPIAISRIQNHPRISTLANYSTFGHDFSFTLLHAPFLYRNAIL